LSRTSSFKRSGVSGASRHNRPGLLNLIARIDEWEMLLCWDFSRLARDSEDLGWIRNRLRLHKRNAIEVSTGLDAFNVGAKVMGVLGEEYLVRLSQDTHRGQRGRVERGYSGGGLPYGYSSEPVLSGRVDHRGNPIPDGYRWVPDDEQAEVVRSIFDRYASGWSCEKLAHDLNAEGVPPPRPRSAKRRGGAWSMTAIREMLRNPIYRGEYIWNKSEWIKDHETGRRRRHSRPESQWLSKHDEAWRILSDELWQQAREAARARSNRVKRSPNGDFAGSRRAGGGRPQHLLSGSLECGVCGGGFHALYRTSWGCGRHKTCGPEVCASNLKVQRAELEQRVLSAIESQILVPENVMYAVGQAFGLVQEQVAGQDPGADRGRLAALEKEQENVARLVARTGELDACARVVEELEEERLEILHRLNASDQVVDPEYYRKEIEAAIRDLSGLLAGAPEEGREALALLLGEDRLRVYPDEAREFRVEGNLTWPLCETAPGHPETTERCFSIVAGTGFEPVTFGSCSGRRRQSIRSCGGQKPTCGGSGWKGPPYRCGGCAAS